MDVVNLSSGNSKAYRSGKLAAVPLSWLAVQMLVVGCAAGFSAEPLQEPNVAVEPRISLAAKTSGPASVRLRSDLKVVLVPVSVTDPLDHPIHTLTAERFRLSEDGIEQKISFFSQEEGPVSLGVLFDSSGSMKNRIASSVESLRQLFLNRIAGDEYFLIRFSDKPTLLSGFTPNPDDITAALASVKAGGWTALLDAVALGAHRMSGAQNPRRALLILSDGDDNNSRYHAAEIRSRVMEADLRIYAIGIMHRPTLLQELAEETGGEVLVANDLSELPDVVRRLSAQIRSQYLLGFRATPVNDGKYHKVKVEVIQDPDSKLRTSWRHGYFSPIE